jgi:hypothetical protein
MGCGRHNAAREEDMSTNATTPFHIWKHEVQVAAIAKGAKAEWLAARFDVRLPIWYRAGETVQGAVDMIEFTRKQEPRETRGEDEASHLRAFVRSARRA